jgi:serine/threonine-protein kinase
MPSLLDMDAATWADINRLLGSALDLPPEEREAWLESLDPAELHLLPRLRLLLQGAARVETGDFLETLPALGTIAGDASVQAPGAAGAAIGPYRLIRELGRGGMGAVWLAERSDGILNRPVALKLPHIASHRANLVERMAREREILASLTHPHIARLYDAGVTAEGQPYLALEYVQGEPIDRYCASHELTLRQMLLLFQQVVWAVAHAHGKLVLHRDLKPANVLVTADGQVRLLDFGVAKLLDEGRTRETALTEFGGPAFTPDYASPEQIRHEPLDIASDVYSLGIILYELLTGVRPYRLKRDSRSALEDAILQADPERPSERAPPGRRKALRGDLDTIVLQALKKNPRERYATVNALGDDLARFLENRPVLARPDSHWYRLKKFVSRNRLPVAAGSAIVLAVLGGALVSAWQSRIAIQEKERAEEVERFVQSIFGEANPYADAGRKMTAVELLHNARAEIDRKFRSRPDLRIELLEIVGSSLRNLGDNAGARSALDAGLGESRKLHGARHIETLRLRALLADVYAVERDVAALKTELATLIPMARESVATDAVPLVRALKDQGLLAFMEGRTEEIAPPVREAFEVGRSRLGERHPLTVDASTSIVEAYQASYETPPKVMLQESERALNFALAAYAGNPDHVQVIRSRETRARVLGVVGYYPEAIVEQKKAIDALTRSIGLSDRIAVEMVESLSSWERRVGDVEESLRHAAQARQILERLGDTHSPDYAYILTNQGNTFLAARRPVAAEAALAQAEKIYVDVYGPAHWDTLTARFNRAMAQAYGGRHPAALESFSVLDDPQVDIKLTWWVDYVRGTVERLAGHSREAVEALARANLAIPDTPRAPWDHARVLTELGQAQLDLRMLDAADATLASAEQLDERLKIRMCPAYADVVLARARIELAREAPARALPRLEQVDTYWRQFDAESHGAADAALWLSRGYRQAGRDREANAAAARAARLSTLASR